MGEKWESQKRAKKELDEEFPHKKGEWEYNVDNRCKRNILKLQEGAKK